MNIRGRDYSTAEAILAFANLSRAIMPNPDAAVNCGAGNSPSLNHSGGETLSAHWPHDHPGSDEVPNRRGNDRSSTTELGRCAEKL